MCSFLSWTFLLIINFWCKVCSRINIVCWVGITDRLNVGKDFSCKDVFEDALVVAGIDCVIGIDAEVGVGAGSMIWKLLRSPV